MTVLVTGGAGYIGSHTALALLDAGRDVVILDDLSTGQIKLIPPAARFYQGDIADTALLARIFSAHRISAVMHFAAKLIVPESVANPQKYHLNNVEKFSVMLAAVRQAAIPYFIFSSTAAVYGEGTGGAVTEETPPAPINPYGETKLLAEKILMDSGMRHVILRYFNVAGADAAGRSGQVMPDATHLIKVACEVAAGRRPTLQIFGTDYPTPDGTCVRDYIHVTDLAAAHVNALGYLENGGGRVTLNCGYGHGYSVRQVVDAMNKIATVVAHNAPRRAGDPATLVADSTKIRALLKWQPLWDDLDAIIRSALTWETKQG